MIILDSNILKGTSLRGPEAELLRVIRTAGVESVVAPWIVLEELAAQQALAYETKYEAAEAAMLKLKAATPWAPVPLPRRVPPEVVRGHWRGRYAEIVGTLATSPSAYEQALFREANLLAPCKTVNSGKHKTGARDAAIWLTAVEYAREHPEESVYFVSNNTEDFGDGSSFPSPMDEDLRELRDRFVLFTSLDGVLTKFAAESSVLEDELTLLLDAEVNRLGIAEVATQSRQFTGTRHLSTTAWQRVPVVQWSGLPTVTLRGVTDIRCHEIAGHKWATATVRWLVAGFARTVGGHRWVGSSWETRVLASPTAPEKGLTVLRGDRPSPLRSSEDIELSVALFLKEPNGFESDIAGQPTTGLEREMSRVVQTLFDLADTKVDREIAQSYFDGPLPPFPSPDWPDKE
ncbi:PIN domain-containing protein [Streptomyces niveus]|uniref:PIN domain-containing protein n=1 Tax=Streptomyces niveus TaxID=193462 RepID=UPI0036E7C174